jgi:hypothetical protein
MSKESPTLSLEDPVELRAQEPTADEIARRAYLLYEARGRESGSELDDWLEAERELQAENARGQR